MSHILAQATGSSARDVLDEHLFDLPDPLWDLLPAAVYICDRNGLILRYNRRAAELWGRAPKLGDPAERFCGSHRMYRLDGGPLPHGDCPMADALRTGQCVRDQEVVIERPDGSRAVALVNIEALKDETGNILGAVNSFNDITERKRIEEELRRSREELEDFFENAVAAMHLVAGDGTILRANQAELDLLGFSREDYVGHHIAEFHADPATIDDVLTRLSRGERLDKCSARLRARDGSIRHVLISSSVQFRSGEFANTRCITLDVTAERRAEAALREKERQSREVLDALPAALYTTDAAGRITYYNEAAVELAGRAPTLGSDEWCVTWKLYRPDGTPLPHDECPMAIALKEDRAVRGMEAIAERPDGTRVPFIPYPTPLHDASGALIGAVNMLVDITDRKRAEEALRQHSAIVESSDDAIISKDINGIVVSWNGGAERLYGYSAEEIIGQPITMLIPLDHQDEEPRILERIRRGERIEHYETVRRCKDGSLIDISLTVSPVKDVQGRIVGASKIARNIGERKRAQEQQDLLVREMSHRVTNLFAVTSGMIALSARTARTPRELAEAVQDRLSALTRAHELTRPGLTGTVAEIGESTTLHALIETIFAPYAAESSRGPEGIVLTGANPSIGRNAVTNVALLLHELATNAVKYGALSVPGGVIHIDCLPGDGVVELVWKERGELALDEEPGKDGFGGTLTERIVKYQLGGQLTRQWRRDGLTVRMTMRLDLLDA